MPTPDLVAEICVGDLYEENSYLYISIIYVRILLRTRK